MKRAGFVKVWQRLACLFVVLQLASRAAGAAQGPPPPVPRTPPAVARVRFEGAQQLQVLAAELDVWEVDSAQSELVAALQPGQLERLQAAGFRVQTALPPTGAGGANVIPDFACYHTVEEIGGIMQQIAAEHPDRAQLVKIGDSYEGRPLWVLRITDGAVPGPKPALFVLANLHGRELITPEVALAFADYMLRYDGVDADVTWLMDYQEMYILASANPDGHIRNESGYPWALWRKNTQPYGTCSAETYGVDLNRNFPLQWGCCAGSSVEACDETYRGPAAASEPEVLAIQAALRGLFGAGGSAARAGQTPAGVLIDLHSYGNLVLYPWSWTASPPPEAAALQAIAGQLASFNGYTPMQGNGLYTADGTADDWAYGELGLAAFTLEIGNWFYPECSEQAGLVGQNLKALLYAARIARSPYDLGQGPQVLSLSIQPPQGGSTPMIMAQAAGQGQVVSAAEYTVDAPPWAGGQPYPLAAADGALDESEETLQADLRETVSGPGRHLIFVRAQDARGFWGPVSAVFYGQTYRLLLPVLINPGGPIE